MGAQQKKQQRCNSCAHIKNIKPATSSVLYFRKNKTKTKYKKIQTSTEKNKQVQIIITKKAKCTQWRKRKIVNSFCFVVDLLQGLMYVTSSTSFAFVSLVPALLLGNLLSNKISGRAIIDPDFFATRTLVPST